MSAAAWSVVSEDSTVSGCLVMQSSTAAVWSRSEATARRTSRSVRIPTRRSPSRTIAAPTPRSTIRRAASRSPSPRSTANTPRVITSARTRMRGCYWPTVARWRCVTSPALTLRRVASRDPVGACERHARHRRGLDRQRDEILWLEVVNMGLATRARGRLRLEREDAQVVRDPAPAEHRVETGRELVVLRRDPCRVAARLPVIVEARRAADLPVLLVVLRAVVAQSDQGGSPDRDRVGTKRERLGDVGAGADAARDDQLHLPVHVQLLEGVHGEAGRRERGYADVLDEDVLRRGGSALHAVYNDDVGPRLDRQLHVVVRARRANLDEDRLLPVGDLAQLVDLDLEVVRSRPVRMAACAALVDPLWQGAHGRDAIGDLVAEQHPAPARLGALADDDLDRVRPPQVVCVQAVARGQHLIYERRRVAALLLGHPAVARGGRRPHLAGSAAERLLRRGGQSAEAHAGDRDRDLQLERLLREAGSQRNVGPATLPIALERVPRHAGP